MSVTPSSQAVVAWLAWLLLHATWIAAASGLLTWLALLIARRPTVRHAIPLVGFLAIIIGVVGAGMITWTGPAVVAAGPSSAYVLDTAAAPAAVRPSASAGGIARADAGRPAGAVTPQAQTRAAEEPQHRLAARSEAIPDHADAWSAWVVSGWACGVLILAINHLIGVMRVRSILRQARPADSGLVARCTALTARLGMASPRLLVSAQVTGPAAIGWWRPAILLPTSLIVRLPADQLEAILLHELAHLRRHDWLVEAMVSAMTCVLFYHPAIWWMARQLRHAREECCDEAATLVGVRPEVFARALLAVAEHLAAPACALRADGGDLTARVQRLLGAQVRSRGGLRAFVAIAILPLAVWLCLAALGIAAEPTSAPPAGKDVSITPADPDAEKVFYHLLHRGGTRVIQLGLARSLYPYEDFQPGYRMFVPVALRFKPIAGRDLITAVAATQGLRVAWIPGKSAAILFAGASDGELARLTKDLASADASQRARAAWRGGWLADPRVIPLLIAAAQDTAPEVARQALTSLARLSWDAAVEIVKPPPAVLEAACASGTLAERCAAIRALGLIGDGQVLALIEAALAGQGTDLRAAAVTALGRSGGGRALERLVEMVMDKTADVGLRGAALEALGDAGGTKVLATFAQALQDHDLSVAAARMLGSIGDEAALPFLEEAIAKRRDQRTPGEVALLDIYAFDALCSIGGDKAFALVEKELGGARKSLALRSLGGFGSERAFVLLQQERPSAVIYPMACLGGDAAAHLVEQAMDDRDPEIRSQASFALRLVGDDLQVPLFEKALQDKDVEVRRRLFNNQQFVGPLYQAMNLDAANQDRSLTVLEKAMTDGDATVRGSAACALGGYRSERSIALLKKALRSDDLALRIRGATGLCKIGDDLALELLGTALADPAVEVRQEVVTALGRLGGPQALKLLAQALGDADSEVRAMATTELGHARESDAKALIRKMLTDKDAAVREAATQAMSDAGGGG